MERDGRSAYGWLIAGMGTGLALALYGLAATHEPELPPEAVARVGGTLILRADYARALDAVAGDKRSPLTDADRSRILDRLVDEELLVQHALQLGLARDAPLVRATLVSAVLDSNLAQADAQPVSEQQAREFYERERGYFTPARTVHARGWRSTDRDAAERAAAALRGGRSPGDIAGLVPLALPDAPLPASRLSTYAGRELAAVAQTLPAGAVSEVIATGDGFGVLHVVSRVDGEPPPFEAVRSEVIRELRRRAAEQSLRQLLEGLRESGDVVVADAP